MASKKSASIDKEFGFTRAIDGERVLIGSEWICKVHSVGDERC